MAEEDKGTGNSKKKKKDMQRNTLGLLLGHNRATWRVLGQVLGA